MKHFISISSLFVLCAFLLIPFSLKSEEKTEKKTVVIQYDPSDRDVTKIVPLETVRYDTVNKVCKRMLSPSGTMAYLKERQSVIIFDKKSNVEKIAAFIKELDVPAVNIRIDVDFVGTSANRTKKLYGKVGYKKYPSSNNQIIIRDGKIVKPDKVIVSAGKGSLNKTRNTSQFIVTRSGHPARLWVGKTIVDPSWLRYHKIVPTIIVPTRGGGGVIIPGSDNEVVWRDIGSALYVLPTYLGNGRIKLELYPVVSYLEDDPEDVKKKRKKIRKNVMVQDIKTSLNLRDGQKVSMGGVISSNKNFYKSLFGPKFLDKDNTDSILDMYVTATVIKPGSSGRKSFIPRTPDVVPKK
jgi:type II secretory pathway component GspD/PulD (secretin)